MKTVHRPVGRRVLESRRPRVSRRPRTVRSTSAQKDPTREAGTRQAWARGFCRARGIGAEGMSVPDGDAISSAILRDPYSASRHWTGDTDRVYNQ